MTATASKPLIVVEPGPEPADSYVEADYESAEKTAQDVVAGRDQERMEALYRIHSEALVRSLLYWTRGDRKTAEDLLQETMLRAWINRHKLRPDPASLRPWLMTVAQRIAIDMLRARAVRPVETAESWFDDIEEGSRAYARVNDRGVIRKALSRLSPDQRAVLAHVYILDLTVPQTARRLGVPEGTVKSRLHYALRAARASQKVAVDS